MTKVDFFEKLRNSPIPVVVDFWAPWCGPCRSIAPVVEKLGHEFAGQVDVWKINTDHEQDLMRSLRIFGIPTLIAFNAGQEVMRRTGAAPAKELQSLFEAAISGNKPAHAAQTPVQRILRLAAGLALFIIALILGLSGINWLLAGLGAIIMFSAVYDRCPIYRMVSTRIKEIFQRNPASISDNNTD
jgi:thioredoxin 1